MTAGSCEALAAAIVAAPRARRSALLARARELPDLAGALKTLADAVLGNDLKEAIRIARLSREAGRRSGDARARATGERALARALHRALRYREAAELYGSAAAAYGKLGLRIDQATAETGRVDVLFRCGRAAEAERAARRALRLFRAEGDAAGAARVLLNLGNLRHLQERHLQAVRLWERARPLLARAGDRGLVAAIDHNLAVSYSVLARFPLSRERFARALAVYRELGEDEMVARVEYNLAYDHFLQGRFHEARRLLARAREVFRAGGARQGLALAARDEAEMALAVSLPRHALAAAEEARRIFGEERAGLEAARAALLGAEALRKLEQPDRAAALVSQARRIYRRADHRTGLAAADLAYAATSSFPPSTRLARAHAAARAFRAQGMIGREATALTLGGAIELERGRRAAGRRILGRAARLARRRRLPEVEVRAEHLLGRAEQEQGHGERALVRHRRAIAAYERLRGGMGSDEDRLAFAADKAVVFEDAIRCALDLGRPAAAFELVERARSRALVDLLAADPRFSQAALREGGRLIRRLARIKEKLSGLEARLRDHERRARVAPREFAAAVRRAVEARDRALGRLERSDPELSYTLTGRPLASLDQVRATIGGERALLAYFVESGRIGVLVVTDRDLRAVRGIATLAEVERELSTLRFTLRAPGLAGASPAASDPPPARAAMRRLERLRTLLVEPIEAWIGERSLVVVPPAVLHAVPFHALARGGRPLIEEREVSFAPSASILVRAEARRPATTGALVVSVPDAAAPAIGEEARAVARALSATLLSGPEATASALRREGSKRRIVHLAAHGVYDATDRLLSGLKLADGLLTVPEVAALGLDAALVTLSACESGAGQPHGDEVLGLVRAALHAGTRSLVASLWSVHDASTAALMTSFYGRVGRGEPVAGALRAAILELRRDHPHPYHWAPFLLVGSWGPACEKTAVQ